MLKSLLPYWRDCLEDAERALRKEQFRECAAITRQRIANYRKWIAEAEASQ